MIINASIDNVEDAACYVGCNDISAGEIEMEYIAEKLGGKGNIVVLQGPDGNSAAVQRTIGINNVLKKYPNIKKLAEQPANWDIALAMSTVENWLQIMDINAVVSENDEMALGAIKAIEGQHAEGKGILVIGVDAIEDGLKAVKSGAMIATVLQDAEAIAKKTIEVAKEVVAGKKVNAEYEIPYKIIDKNNIDQYLKYPAMRQVFERLLIIKRGLPMKAVVVQKPGVLEVMDVKEPPMGEYEARCQMLYGGTCTGTDLAVIDGEFAWGNVYPSIIGHEGIGRVVEVGKKVRNFKVGDLISRVYTRAYDGMELSWGAMCEFGLACDHGAMLQDGIDRAKWDMFRINKVIPEGIIDPMDAVMIITWRENLSWVNRLGVVPGQRVLTIGSGANGISISAMCAIKGAEAVMVGSGKRKDNALGSGTTLYVDYRDEAAVKALIDKNARAFDVIIDATGQKETLTPYMSTLKEGGTAAVYGMDDYYNYTFNPILGPVSFRWFNAVYDEAETHEEVMDLIRAKKLDAGNWIDRKAVYTWDNATEAYADVRNKKAVKTALKLSR